MFQLLGGLNDIGWLSSYSGVEASGRNRGCPGERSYGLRTLQKSSDRGAPPSEHTSVSVPMLFYFAHNRKNLEDYR